MGSPLPAVPSVTLTPAAPEHVPELGRICYEAFKELQDKHRFPVDFPSVQVGRQVVGLLVARPEFYGIAAKVGDELAGSNFLLTADETAGVGPITVDSAFQGRSVGRQLMLDVIREARDRKIDKVRLVQEAFNTRSISLYAALGFETRHGLSLMRPTPAELDDVNIRSATEKDLAELDALCKRIYKVSRRHELAMFLQMDFPVLIRVRDGKVCGYLVPGLLGHGVAETEDDALALARQAARRSPEPTAVFCPLDQHELFRTFLKARFENLKMMNLMTMGPYQVPDRVWMPSILY
jgi:GNAT superfamily N-acetyltransferase